ncbi:MAG: LysR family transcriptional regulator [Stellaceae bacterium]
MRNPGFEEMSAFAAIAERRSFAKAAVALGISPSTLSQTIRELEERLGVRLLNRTTRSVAPTEAGERLLERLRPLFADFDAAIDTVRAFRDKLTGVIRLTVPPPAASFILAPVLQRFFAAYPDIKLEISVDLNLIDIVADRFDAGIRLGNRVDRDMIAVRVSDPIQRVLIAAPAYLARNPAPATPRDLLRHNAIRFRLPGGGFIPWRFHENGKSFEIAPEGSLIVNDPEMAVRAALDGVGVLYTSVQYVNDAITDGRLTPLLGAWMPTEMDGFFLYYPSRRHMPAPLQALINFLRGNLKNGLTPRVEPPSIGDGSIRDVGR